MPWIIGFCMLSLPLFWSSTDYFTSFPVVFYTTFAVQGGDILWDVGTGLQNARFLLGERFFYVYVFFAVALVQNVINVVVEDSYISIKYSRSFRWLTGDPKGGEGGIPDTQ